MLGKLTRKHYQKHNLLGGDKNDAFKCILLIVPMFPFNEPFVCKTDD